MVDLWKPCDKGCPNRYDCPDVPPVAERCPESRRDGEWRDYASCKILGPHEIHNDGHGTRWWPDDEDTSA